MAKGCDSSWDFDYKSRVDLFHSTSCMFSSVLSQDSLFRDKILWAEDVFSAHNIFR